MIPFRLNEICMYISDSGVFKVNHSSLSQNQPAGTTVRMVGNKIYNSAGQAVTLRGPEITMSSGYALDDIDVIAATGANAVRLLMTTDAINGMTPELFDQFFAKLQTHNMIAWVSFYTWNTGANYDIGSSLGGGNFYNLTAPAGYGVCSIDTPGSCYLAMWDRQWVKDLMEKYKDRIIIDAMQEYIADPAIANEPDSVKREAWKNDSISHINFFRSRGYTQPLAIMSNFEGRDLYAIIQHANTILNADTVKVNGQSQIIFGWQAYWSVEGNPNFYPDWQGPLITGSRLTATQAIDTVLPNLSYPVQCGFDNYAGDTNHDWQIQIEAAARQGINWLWWDYRNSQLDCPVDGETCRTYVLNSLNGFAGARNSLYSPPNTGGGGTISALPLTMKTIWTGHSIPDNFVKGPLQDAIALMGATASVRASTGPYATAQIRWNDRPINPDEVRGLLEAPGAQYDIFVGGEAHGGNYDGRASVATHIEWSDAYGYAVLWHNLAASTGAKTYYFNFWRNDPARLFDSSWRAAQELEKPLWTQIINYVNTHKQVGTPDMKIIPWLEVFCAIYDGIQAGQVTGLNMRDIFIDDVHCNTDLGRWIQIATVLAVVYHRNPTELPANAGSTVNISPTLAAQLRPIIWNTCLNDPRTGMTA